MAGGGWGGAREGAGRKPADYEPSEDRLEFEEQRARHEKIKADQREFKLAQERGEYVSRAGVSQAAATAVAVMTQSLRSIADNLERVCGLTPEQAELAQQQVDAALTEMAAAMRVLAGE